MSYDDDGDKKNEIVRVGFRGGEIEAVQLPDGSVWVSVRRVCEHLGIDPWNQQLKLKEQPWARTVIITVPDVRGHKQEAFMLHLDNLPMWLTKINRNKVSPDTQPLLDAYQKEADGVLRDYFYGRSPMKMPTYVEALRQLADQLETNAKIKNENHMLKLKGKVDRPFILAGKAMINTEAYCKIAEFAKSVKIDGKILGPLKMFQFLRAKGVLFKKPHGDNLPYQCHIDTGRFIVQQGTHPDGHGGEKIHHTTYITRKGEGYVINLMINDPLFLHMSITVRGENRVMF